MVPTTSQKPAAFSCKVIVAVLPPDELELLDDELEDDELLELDELLLEEELELLDEEDEEPELPPPVIVIGTGEILPGVAIKPKFVELPGPIVAL